MIDYSICMIVKNEEKRLVSLLPILVNSGAEVIVVDTGSTDSTIEICKNNNVKLLHFEWVNDFSKARNHSLSAATRPMILWLDADDSPSQDFFNGLPSADVENCYSIIVKSPIEGAEAQSFRQTRVFPNFNRKGSTAVQFKGLIHESVSSRCDEIGLNLINLDLELIHNGYLLESDRNSKSKRNLELLELERKSNPKDAVFWIEIGNAYFQMGDFKPALKCYLTVFDLSRKEQNSEIGQVVYLNLANTYESLGDSKSSEYYLGESINKCSHQIEAHYKLAKKSLLSGEVEQSLKLIEKGLIEKEYLGSYVSSYHASRANLYGLMGLSHSLLKDWTSATHTFIQSRQEGYKWTVDPWLAIECAFKSDQIEQAKEWWLELDESNKQPTNSEQIKIVKAITLLQNPQEVKVDSKLIPHSTQYNRTEWERKLRKVLRGELDKEALTQYSKNLGNLDFTLDFLNHFGK